MCVLSIRQIEEAMLLVEVDEIATLLHQLKLLSSNSEVGDVMNAHEYLEYEMELDLNNPYAPTDEVFLHMYSSTHQEIDVDEVMVDVLEEVEGLSVAQHSLETLENTLNKDQTMAYHTSGAFKDSRRKLHLIIWKILIRPLYLDSFFRLV
jgi:hypothetical protein